MPLTLIMIKHKIYYYPYKAFGDQKNRVFHALCDKKGNIINIVRAILLISPGLYETNHVTLIYVYDMSLEFIVPRIALCPAHLSYSCYVPQALAFVRFQNGSRQSPTIVR